MSAREDILASVRASLDAARREVVLPPRPDGPAPGAPRDLADPVGHFRARLESVGGHVVVVPDEEAAADAVQEIARGATRIAVSDLALAEQIARGVEGASVLSPGCSREDLLAADIGVTGARFGIAETGTLVLVSASEKSRLASLVPPVHVALLRASDILGTLGDALTAVRGERGAVTFVTGPSRTADIELTLVVGVHGPKELHVVVVGEP